MNGDLAAALEPGSLLLLLGGLTGPAQALDPELALTQYVQNVWRAPETLPHDDVTAIVQSRDGYLWLGTVEGLARFDGVRSVVFDRSNTPALTNNWVESLLENRSGRLWIGTYGGGLWCRERERWNRGRAGLDCRSGALPRQDRRPQPGRDLGAS